MLKLKVMAAKPKAGVTSSTALSWRSWNIPLRRGPSQEENRRRSRLPGWGRARDHRGHGGPSRSVGTVLAQAEPAQQFLKHRQSVLCGLGEKVFDSGFQFRGVVGPVSVNLPGFPGKFPMVGFAPSLDGAVGLTQTFVGTDV